MTLNIAINGRFQQRRMTGVDRYAHEISKHITLSKYFIVPTHPLGQITGHLWEQFILPARIQRDDVLWSPANAGPWLVRNQVISMHDASVFDHPEWFNPSFASWTRLSWKILAKRVKAILTVSNFSRNRLKFHLGIPDAKIHVVYNGVGKPFEPQPQKAIEDVKEKYGLNKPYFLFVGTNEPRKNLARLIQAWENLNLRSHSLFIAGAEGKVFSKHRGQKAQPQQVFVSDEMLPALYAGAEAVVIPSLYEGFGLTVLEAMACGAPVIASNIEVFREIFEGAALFVNQNDPKEIANAMMKMVDDRSFAIRLREQGLSHAANFSWDTSAQKIKTILEGIR